MIRRVVWFIGTARPRPMPATAVLMPTTRPLPSASAPPELPGFSAASVWMTSSMIRADRRPRTGSDRPRRTDDARGHAPGQPQRVAHGHDQGSDPEVLGVAVRRWPGDRTVDPDHREVGERVSTHDLEAGGGAVGERRLPRARVTDDVGVRDQVALVAQHHGRAGRLPPLPADPERGHPGRQRLGNADDDG